MGDRYRLGHKPVCLCRLHRGGRHLSRLNVQSGHRKPSAGRSSLRVMSGSLVAPAYEVSGAPPGGEVIPEPYGWMGQTNLNWWGLWVLAPCLGGKVFILPPPGGGKFTALRAWELAVLVRAGRGTMTAFVTMERAGLVPQGGKIESLPTERKRLQLGCVRITRSPKQQSAHKNTSRKSRKSQSQIFRHKCVRQTGQVVKCSHEVFRVDQPIASVGICPGRQESEVEKKESDNLTFLWKPDWYGVEIRVLSLLNVLFLWHIR